MTRPTLTRVQRDTLGFIVDVIDLDGYPPSIRDIQTFFGYGSTSTVAHQLRQLVYKGYLVREFGKPRAMRVIP